VRRMHVWTPRAFAAVDFASRTSTLVRPDAALVDRRLDLASLAAQDPEQRAQRLEALLPRQQRQCEPVDALLLELNDFVESIRGRGTAAPGCVGTAAPGCVGTAALGCSGEQGRDAVALAERILAKIAAHAWDDQPDGLVGPLAIPRPSVLPAPHWQMAGGRTRREAG